jgi:soluble lytic murein transglycosylase-like protein
MIPNAPIPQRPDFTTPPVTPTNGVPLNDADRFLKTAMSFLGQPYRYGGGHINGTFAGPGPVDCSGLVSQSAKMSGHPSIYGTAKVLQGKGQPVSMNDLKPGDLVFKGDPAYHTGIYIGDGKVIHAPRTGDVVKVVSVQGWESARRIFNEAGQAVDTTGIDVAPSPYLGKGAANAARRAQDDNQVANKRVPSNFSLPAFESEEERKKRAQREAMLLGGGNAPAAGPAAPLDGGTHSGLAGVDSTDAGNFENLLGKLEAAGITKEFLQQLSEQYGVPLKMILAVIQQESGGDPNAQSGAGAQGLMQLMPATAADLGVENSFDPKQNVTGGVKYLSQMLKMFDGDPQKALAAYNAGPGNVQRYGGIPPFQETQHYVKNISAMMTANA